MDGWMDGGREGGRGRCAASRFEPVSGPRLVSIPLRLSAAPAALAAGSAQRLCRRAGPSGRRLAWPTGSAGRGRSTFRVRWGRREGGSEETVRRLRLCPRAGRRWAEPAAASRRARAAHGCGESVSSEPARDQDTDTRARRRVRIGRGGESCRRLTEFSPWAGSRWTWASWAAARGCGLCRVTTCTAFGAASPTRARLQAAGQHRHKRRAWRCLPNTRRRLCRCCRRQEARGSAPPPPAAETPSSWADWRPLRPQACPASRRDACSRCDPGQSARRRRGLLTLAKTCGRWWAAGPGGAARGEADGMERPPSESRCQGRLGLRGGRRGRRRRGRARKKDDEAATASCSAVAERGRRRGRRVRR